MNKLEISGYVCTYCSEYVTLEANTMVCPKCDEYKGLIPVHDTGSRYVKTSE